jgi:hypothetical protein
MKKLTKRPQETALQRHVRLWLNDRASEYENGLAGVKSDLFRDGCESGYVSHLTDYVDCDKFVAKYAVDIFDMIDDDMDESGNDYTISKNHRASCQVAWWAFEQTAYTLLNEVL